MLDILIAARILLGLVLLAAGSTKLFALRRFSRVLRSYALLPELAIAPVTLALPVAELVLGVALFGGWSSRLAATCAVVLLLLFAAGVAANVARKNTIECGCGGFNGPTVVTWSVVGRNVVLACLAATVAVTAPPSVPVALEQGHVTASDVLALALGAGLALVLLSVTRSAVGVLRITNAVARLASHQHSP